MKKVALLVTFFLLAVSMGVGYYVGKQKAAEPKVKVTAVVYHLTDEEFQEVDPTGFINPTKEDFRKFVFDLNVTQPKEIRDRKVTLPPMKEGINQYDNSSRYLSGESSQQDNPLEDFARYHEEFIFYAKGLDNSTIKGIYRPQMVTVSWTTKEGEPKSKQVGIGERIRFK
ncbi:hypothetical protein [Candidatus Formimonas warabiya]|uniref:Uncharacterized protein n=1 Tax=Formimonas warabiya TaxID=1761012 RepID=A0A3G1KUC4_FORW1|nr:hypothetical protein [Candidatus Formimonas warabiya]ATW26059.1 hypothetical protein DCMF_15900 [Candidatus Formimonas warabiya]